MNDYLIFLNLQLDSSYKSIFRKAREKEILTQNEAQKLNQINEKPYDLLFLDMYQEFINKMEEKIPELKQQPSASVESGSVIKKLSASFKRDSSNFNDKKSGLRPFNERTIVLKDNQLKKDTSSIKKLSFNPFAQIG